VPDSLTLASSSINIFDNAITSLSFVFDRQPAKKSGKPSCGSERIIVLDVEG
jgi:hypothetical protein